MDLRDQLQEILKKENTTAPNKVEIQKRLISNRPIRERNKAMCAKDLPKIVLKVGESPTSESQIDRDKEMYNFMPSISPRVDFGALRQRIG